jgi:hypothetical protein
MSHRPGVSAASFVAQVPPSRPGRVPWNNLKRKCSSLVASECILGEPFVKERSLGNEEFANGDIFVAERGCALLSIKRGLFEPDVNSFTTTNGYCKSQRICSVQQAEHHG